MALARVDSTVYRALAHNRTHLVLGNSRRWFARTTTRSLLNTGTRAAELALEQRRVAHAAAVLRTRYDRWAGVHERVAWPVCIFDDVCAPNQLQLHAERQWAGTRLCFCLFAEVGTSGKLAGCRRCTALRKATQ